MQNQARSFYAGRSILITGVCGTVGSELLRQLSNLPGVAVTGIDNNESELFSLAELHSDRPELDFFLGDLRDRDTLQQRFRGHEIVFHTAAFKHVGLSERSPRDVVQCNVIGTQNVIEAATASQVKVVNFTSSDKAVNPTNVMGTSKLLGERLMTAGALHQRGRGGPIFFSTRFGNVLGSRGSVIPLFRQQIARGGPVTLTDKSMTRFIMTLEQSVGLVLDAAAFAVGGEVFVTKMLVANIFDLALVMIEELAPAYGHAPGDVEIRTIGPRPGEKMYEELLTEEETRRAIDVDGFIVVHPPGRPARPNGDGGAGRLVRPYNSGVEVPLSPAELRHFLFNNGLLDIDDSLGRRRCA